MTPTTLPLRPQRSDIFTVTPQRKSLHDIEDDELLFRIAYIPYVIGAVAWDWVDSILDQAAQMRISATKGLARGIRELKKSYDRFRETSIYQQLCAEAQHHCECFQDGYADYFADMYKGMKEQIRYYYPHLLAQWVDFKATVYVTLVVIKALHRYVAWCDKRIRELLGGADNSILPQHFQLLYTLVYVYLGDDNMAINMDDLSAEVEALTDVIHNIKFSKDKEEEEE